MKIRGKTPSYLAQPPNLQTFRPLWTWKALFQAHQEVDLQADGQREHASHCEQSQGEFPCTPSCQVSLPSNRPKNMATGRRILSSWHWNLFVTELCFFLRFRNTSIFLESGVHEETDSTFFANCPFLGTQINKFWFISFITAALLARLSAWPWTQ